MAKKKKEEVVDQTTEKPIVDDKVEKIQIKKQPKKFAKQDDIIKVDLSKPSLKEEEKSETTEKIKNDNIDDTRVVELVKDAEPVQEQKEVQPEAEAQETSIIEEVVEKEKVEEIAQVAEEAITESIETGEELPENIQKLVNFMEETGGDLNDYVKLNRDYSDLDNDTLLREYYKQTKPHLSEDEIEFIMEDNFSFDEDEHDDKEIKRKKLALKEQVASAKSHLDGLKSKYYEDIKAGSKLTKEQQEAINFFDRYNKESEESNKIMEKQANTFSKQTDNVFNKEFKGFEYSVGDKRFRFNVKDANKVKETQSDINNFIKKFLNEENLMSDAGGYHKSLFTAMNADAVANHFYEQGKADALKESIAKSKNINMDPRKTHVENLNTSGLRVRALEDDGPDFKFQIKNKK
tara:strand:- start:972 stop:2189 length:1218 start_codon:yes stop_codon:yes gene_type:complete